MLLSKESSKNIILPELKAKLIFNATSGRLDQSPEQLVTILTEMQKWNIVPEVYMVRPESQLTKVVASAVRRGIKLVVVCGGDGTIDSTVGGMVGTHATLGVIPVGTQNNTARSLGVPLDDIPAAVALLRHGERIRLDVGYARSGRAGRWFLESCTVGLISALYPAADDIQHGKLNRIGDLLSALVSSTPGNFHIELDHGREKINTQAHVALVSNMPYLGAQFKVAPDIAFDDGLFNVLVYSEMNKLDLIEYAVQQVAGSPPEDPRVKHYRANFIRIQTSPNMPVMSDGFTMGEGSVTVRAEHGALSVMANPDSIANRKTINQLQPRHNLDAG